MKFLNGFWLAIEIEKGEIIDSVVINKGIEMNILGEVYEGIDFAKLLKQGIITAAEGVVADVYVNSYKTNISFTYNGKVYGSGDCIIDIGEWYALCKTYNVEVEWCKYN